MTDTETALERVKIKQNRGPTIEFDGRLLCETEWESGDRTLRLELWQTKGGAFVPVTYNYLPGKQDIVSATVVDPADEATMRFAAMDQWDWNDRARAMVRKDLGWKLKLVVE